MGKVKAKGHDNELQFLRKKVRDLNKLNRQLQKQLKHHTKTEHFFEDIKAEVEEFVADKEETKKKVDERIPCHDCNIGFYDDILDIMDKIYATCNECGKRKRLK